MYRRSKPLLDIFSASGRRVNLNKFQFNENKIDEYVKFVNNCILKPYYEHYTLVNEKLEKVYTFASVYNLFIHIKTFTFYMINIVKRSFVEYNELKTLEDLISELHNEYKTEYTEQTVKTEIKIEHTIDVELDMAYILYHQIYGIPNDGVYETYKLEVIIEAIKDTSEN